jgi:hypothetical protein
VKRAPDDRELEALHRRLDAMTSMDVPDGGQPWNDLRARLSERADSSARPARAVAARRAPIRRALAVAAAVVLVGGTAMAASPTVDIPVFEGLFDEPPTQTEVDGSQAERDAWADDRAGSDDDPAPAQPPRGGPPDSLSNSGAMGASVDHDADDAAGGSDEANHDEGDTDEDLDGRGSDDANDDDGDDDDDGDEEQGDGGTQDVDDDDSGHGGGGSSDDEPDDDSDDPDED